jgi:DNA-binding winged helix-turn-helix (wHTH) protein/Tol biopolymer transport system component
MTASKSFVFRFSDLEVREREFCLIKTGEVLQVEPKAFRVLLHLLHNPQRLISKEELLNAVWGDASVSENSLPQNIGKLRRLLSDDVRNPRYIETVATVGYRFICKVEAVADDLGSVEGNGEAAGTGTAVDTDASMSAQAEKSDEEATAMKTQQAVARRLRRRWLLAGAGILVAGLACLLWYLRRPQVPLRISGFTQITRDGRHKTLTGGSDATTLYFNRYPNSQPIYEVPKSGGEIEPVPVDLPYPLLLDVSHVDSSFLVRTGDGEINGLWIVQPFQKSQRHLLDADIESAAWSPDGKSVVYSLENGDIDVIRADGSDAHRLITMKNTGFPIVLFRWSPDGKTIRFDRNYRIYEVSADGTGLHEFLQSWRPKSWQCCGQWTPDGKFYFFLEWDTPVDSYPLRPPYQLWGLDERRGLFRSAHPDPFQLTTSPIRWGAPMSERDGTKIYVRGEFIRGELVQYDPQSHQLQNYLGGISAEGVNFSKDGRYMAYVAFPEGTLWRANRDGSNPVQLTSPPLYPLLPRWSPDGTQILFFATDADGRERSYVVSAHGGDPYAFLPEDTRDEETPDWSPDGRKVVFYSVGDENDPYEGHLSVLDLASRQGTAISGSNSMAAPRWSPDGRFIAAHSYNGAGGTSVFDFKTARWTVVQKGGEVQLAWSRDSQFLYFLRPVDDVGVFRIRPSGGKAERVVDLKGFRFISVRDVWMDLDPDDRPMFLRDTGSDEIYALTLEEK